MKVAVDAIGGDQAPQVVVQGGAEAVSELGIDIILVGNKEVISEALSPYSVADRIEVYHCEEVVRMDESPLKAIRKKKMRPSESPLIL